MKYRSLGAIFALLPGLMTASNLAAAPDLLREARFADELVDNIVTGDPEWLKNGDSRFLSIFAEADNDRPQGGVILLHGMGAHPDWATVIHPLRSALPKHGWATLSVQMPVAHRSDGFEGYFDLFEDATTRITAAVEFLESRGIRNIALIGHSMGALMGSFFVAESPEHRIKALITIGLNGRETHSERNALRLIEKINIPMLDIYGSEDLPGVQSTHRARATAARKAGNKDYRQLKILGADHFFNYHEEQLLIRTRSWLHKTIPGKVVRK
jgi:pimeloyl-ACP methyl ester carboxylesterase